jgi:putative Mg2+ transporter-C (MgtC) family protein
MIAESYLSLLSPLIEVHLFLAALLGALIGLERELAGKDPSLRTFALISLGSCMFSMLSTQIFDGRVIGDPARIAAQIVPGIGFIGAGTIFKSRGGVTGLTTAALMWVTAAIGMAVGFNRLSLAVSGTLIALIIMVVLRLLHRFTDRVAPPVKRQTESDSSEPTFE